MVALINLYLIQMKIQMKISIKFFIISFFFIFFFIYLNDINLVHNSIIESSDLINSHTRALQLQLQIKDLITLLRDIYKFPHKYLQIYNLYELVDVYNTIVNCINFNIVEYNQINNIELNKIPNIFLHQDIIQFQRHIQFLEVIVNVKTRHFYSY